MISPISPETTVSLPLVIISVIIVMFIIVFVSHVVDRRKERRLEIEKEKLCDAIDSWLEECAELTREYEKNNPKWKEEVERAIKSLQ